MTEPLGSFYAKVRARAASGFEKSGKVGYWRKPEIHTETLPSGTIIA